MLVLVCTRHNLRLGGRLDEATRVHWSHRGSGLAACCDCSDHKGLSRWDAHTGPPISPTADRGAVLFDGLAKRGYMLGQNLVHEARGASGKPELVPRLISGVPTVLASGSGDPVKTGLVESLAHPGGNVTGIADDASTLSTKRLSLLTALLPKLHRVAMLWNRDDLGMSMRYEASAEAAQGVGITVQPLGVREPDDFNEAFEAMKRDPPDAILMVSDSLTLLNRKRVIDYAAAHRLPAIYEAESIVRDGGLMSYGADSRESFDRAAAMVDLILKGTKPADLPVEQPTRYQFVINLKTAKSIGLEIPPTLSALADEVIE